jgi:hypothetical protein
MSKKLVLLVSIMSLALGSLMTLATPAMAVDVLSGPCSNQNASTSAVCQDYNQQTKAGNPNPIYGPGGVLTKVITVMSVIVGVISVIMVIISGMRIALSGGKPNEQSSARSGLLYALVGLAVAGLAQALVAFVLNNL